MNRVIPGINDLSELSENLHSLPTGIEKPLKKSLYCCFSVLYKAKVIGSWVKPGEIYAPAHPHPFAVLPTFKSGILPDQGPFPNFGEP